MRDEESLLRRCSPGRRRLGLGRKRALALQLADGHAAGAAFRGGGRTGARGSTGSVCPADARERVAERPPSGDGGASQGDRRWLAGALRRSPVALPREIRRGKDGRGRGEHLAGCRRLAALLRLQPPRLESRRRARRGWERSLRGGLHRAGLCFF